MKKIEAIIKPFKLEEIKEALANVNIHGMTAYEVKGYGSQQGHVEVYRGNKYKVDFTPKIKIEIIVSNNIFANLVINIIKKISSTGNIGDGKIFVSTIDKVIRIRTNEEDDKAL